MKEEDVEEFLKNVKRLLNEEKYSFESTEKNNTCWKLLELLESEIIATIKGLTSKNYIKGPTASHKYGSKFEIWVFGAEIEYNEIYIKLEYRVPEYIMIISFHIADYKLKYKYK